ncbi:DUF5687 family protein [Daejeonella sp.]|uniref:DUF5687 family protein n=1 Tax=Daejeonella sp. TaxID=2805397 RepID=UPI0030C2F605
MTLTFLSQQWKAFWRSQNKGKSLAMRIVMGILIVYLLLNVLVVAFFMDKILVKTYPGQDILQTFNSFIIYYFLMDLIMRFQLQELPTLSIRPYLHLPISKNQIVNYLSVTSLATAFNLTPFLLTIPFLIKVLIPQHGIGAFWGYMACIFGLTLFSHFFSLWLKRKVNLNAFWMLGFFGLLLIVWALEFYFKLISLSSISKDLFNAIINEPSLSAIAVLLGFVMFMINHNYLKSNLYLEELQTSKSSVKSSTEIPYFDRFGIVGDLAANELKLILRNKRPRSVLMMCMMFMFYGLIFYNNPKYDGYGHIVFCGMFMTGIFIINYGQFMFSWQSAHFDGILSNRVQPEDFFKSKFLLFDVFSTFCFLLTIPYVYFGWKVLIVHFVMYVWNLGVNTILVLYFANQNYKRIDLTKGGSFNWEGVGASQWILSIPLMITPFLIYVPFSYFDYPEVGLAAIAIIGIIAIFTREFWLRKLVTIFRTKRYAIAEGFRNQ